MSQAILFLGLHLLGLSVALAVGPTRRVHLCAALAFTTGLVVMVGLEIALLVAHITFGRLSGGLAAALVIAICALVVRRRGGLAAGAWRALGAWTAGFALVAALLSSGNYAILSFDSHFLVLLGGIIGKDGAFVPGLLEQMGMYGSFQALAQGLVCFTDRTFLYALPPVFAASTIAAFVVLLRESFAALALPASRGRDALVGLVTLATFTIYMVFRHSFYVHTNFGAAAYLLAFCALTWLAEVDDDPSLVPLAFLALFGLALSRIEAPLVAGLFVVLAILPSRLPARRVLPAFAGYTAATALWYTVLGRAVPATSIFLTPMRCYLFAAATCALLGFYALSSWPRAGWLRRLSRHAPLLVAVVVALALAGAFVLRPAHMGTSLAAWASTLWMQPYWEGAWLAIVGLAVLGFWVPAPPARWTFVVGVPAYLAVILLLVLGRHPYHVGIGDSAARMAVHLVPLAFFYFALKFAPLLVATEPATSAPAEARS